MDEQKLFRQWEQEYLLGITNMTFREWCHARELTATMTTREALLTSLAAEREKVKKLRGGIEKLTAKCPCWSGGFENGEFAKQPCEYCDPLMSLLAETAPEKNAGSPKEADHE